MDAYVAEARKEKKKLQDGRREIVKKPPKEAAKVIFVKYIFCTQVKMLKSFFQFFISSRQESKRAAKRKEHTVQEKKLLEDINAAKIPEVRVSPPKDVDPVIVYEEKQLDTEVTSVLHEEIGKIQSKINVVLHHLKDEVLPTLEEAYSVTTF